MRRLSLGILLLASCATTPGHSSSVAAIYDDYIAARAKLDPNWATGVGIHDYDDRLTRYDDASYDARHDLVLRILNRLRALDPALMDEDERIDYRLFRAQLEVEAYDYRREDYRERSPSLPLDSASAVYDLLIKDFAPIEKRVPLAAARLAGVAQVVGDAKAHLKHPPKVWTEMELENLKDTIDSMKDFAVTARERGAKDVTAIEKSAAQAQRALEEYRAWLQKEVLPRSDGTFSVGAEVFNYYLHTGFLLSLNSDELLALGHREFDRTLGMLDEVAKRIDPKKSWRDILEEMKKDHPKADDVLSVYRAETVRARSFMIEKSVVGIPEWEKLEVIETPPFDRAATPTAAYHQPGPLDAARIGHFYVTPPPKEGSSEVIERALAAHNVYDIPGTVWHEAYPGHHLQFVYAKDVASKVRRLNNSPLLSEGWGFYCEELANELGYYTNPKERLMQLNWRLLRGARIICDVSLHTGKMTYDEAVKFLEEEVRMNKEQAVPAVRAFSREPTYYSSYMLGMLEIVRIREKFRAKLGSRFTLKEFHERLLRFGNVPPALIESELDRTWK